MSASTITPVREMSGQLSSTLRHGLRRTGIEVKQFFREGSSIVFTFAYPVIMFIIFASIYGSDGASMGRPGADITFPHFFLPGMVATGVLLSSFQTVASAIPVEREDGTLKRLWSTPMPPAAYFIGQVGRVLVLTAIQLVLLLGVAAFAYDVPMPTDPSAIMTFVWAVVLGSAACTVCGIAFSSVMRSGRTAPTVAAAVALVLQFLSGVFFEFATLPSLMQNVASIFPLRWIAQAMRSVFLPASAESWEASGEWQLGIIAIVLVAWLAVALAISLKTFRWRPFGDD